MAVSQLGCDTMNEACNQRRSGVFLQWGIPTHSCNQCGIPLQPPEPQILQTSRVIIVFNDEGHIARFLGCPPGLARLGGVQRPIARELDPARRMIPSTSFSAFRITYASPSKSVEIYPHPKYTTRREQPTSLVVARKLEQPVRPIAEYSMANDLSENLVGGKHLRCCSLRILLV